jgi:PKD repeat protein
MTVNNNVTPSVSIASNVGTTICSGASVTFTATPTNGGGSPTYNFRVNGSTVQNTTSNTYTTTGLTNGQTVNVIMTSNATCPSPTTATSSTLTMTVNNNVTPSVSIASNVGTTICSGASVTFTATPTNGGGSPTYNFRVNGSTVQNTTSNTYTTAGLTNGQTVNVIMTSNATCPSPATATSSTLTMIVNPILIPSISISSSQTNLCTSGMNFTSSINNGGVSPTYQWKKNGSNILGETNSTYTATNLINGDLITCELTSNATCASPNTAVSNSISVNLLGSTTTWLGLSNDWSVGSPINWSNGYPSSNTTAIIQAGTPNDPQINDIVECFNIEIQAGASLTINSVNQLNIYGKLTNNGTLNTGFGSVEFLSCTGSSAQAHEITSTNGTTSTFFDINLNDLAGLNLTANANISGTLTLTNGSFNNLGQVFTFLSTATGTARIAPVGATASYNGNITMQRYAPGPKTGWAQLGTPIQGATLAQWYDNFPMQGFIGVFGGGSSGFVSVYSYNETIAGLFDANGSYIPATNVTNSIAVGKGFWLYLGSAGAGGSSTINTLPITIDVTGQPTTGNFNFNPSYTNSGNPFDDGFNLVANPYPSAIDWLSSNWTKTNINNAIYMYQADNGQYASFVGGIATNGGSRYIASSQGFYIQANAASPVLNITENAKSASNPVLIKEEDPAYVLRIKVEGNEWSDEMVIHLNNQATTEFDGSYDAKKIFSNNPSNPSISSICNNKDLAINSLPFTGTSITIPVRVTVGSNGMYHLKWTGLQGFEEGSCFVIEDLDNGNKTALEKDGVYYFNATAGFKAPRFVLHINTPLPTTIIEASCSNTQDGAITVCNLSNSTCKVELKDARGNLLKEAQITGSYTFDKLAIGNYILSYPMVSDCGNLIQKVMVKATNVVTADFEVSNQTVKTNEDVVFSTQQSKGNTITWDFGDGTALSGVSSTSHQYHEDGVYTVSLTNQKGECSVTETMLLTVNKADLNSKNGMQLVKQDGVYYAIYSFQEVTIGSVRVTNALGQEVCSTQQFQGKYGKLRLQLDNFSEGIYMVVMSNGKETITNKIVK